MEFQDTQSYRCFKSICLWSLLSDLIVILSFFASYVFSFVYHDWGYVGWIVPLIVKLFFVLCFAIANGYLVFVLYLAYRKREQNIPLVLVNKTEQIFNKTFANNLIKKILVFISIFSFILNLFISIINLYTIIACFITLGILLLINSRK